MTSPSDNVKWRPSTSMDVLRQRAALLAEIRAFFAAHGVLEVETPVLSQAAVTDPNLESFSTRYTGPGAATGQEFYLQTSPEFPMKRLLAAGSGPIYQICKVFRNGEAGRLHNPEFTMLEWYRPGFDHHQLMDEVETLLEYLLKPFRTLEPPERYTYRQVFLLHAGVDPLTAPVQRLVECAASHGVSVPDGLTASDPRDVWLDLILTHVVEPHLGRGRLCFVYDYPASQAALARLRNSTDDDPAVAERFELYLDGIELANGFHELGDPGEQRRRFEADQHARRERGLPEVPFDALLLEALAHGLPDCAGVALGVDRVLKIACGAATLQDVIAFPYGRA